MPHERRDVLEPLLQRGQQDREDVDPIPEILAERLLLDHRRKVAVGGGHDPHVHVQRRFAADALDLMILQHPQEPHLRRQRQFPDLVEKERAPVGPFEPALMLFRRAGETPLFMAEELRVDEFGGNRTAIDANERPVGPLRPRVDRA